MQKSDIELEKMYSELQSFLELSSADTELISQVRVILEPSFPDLVEDFYAEIDRHEVTRKVIADNAQRDRLKHTLRGWLAQLLGGKYDLEFVKSRWRVGYRHVEIQLDQIYATAALGRLRLRMTEQLSEHYTQHPTGDCDQLGAALTLLNKLLDMDCAIINAAYQINSARQLEETAQKQMRQSERLAAIGQMVTGLAHESRNALQRSHACLETLVLDIEDRPEALNLVHRVQSALDHLHTLYEEVRNYAAPIKLDRQELSLTKLAAHCWANLQHRWNEKRTVLNLESEESPVSVIGDRIRLDQVLTNLLQNAIDACGEQGTIDLAISQKDDRVYITVKDNGDGIKLNPPSKVFEPFLTTKTRGTGLGLAITKRIVEAHRGTITVENLDQGGACFRIELPGNAAHPTESA